MTDIISDLISNHLVRKTKKQKNSFRRKLITNLEPLGYSVKLNKVNMGFKCTNVIVGDPNEAKIILTAHYDTQASLGVFPNFCTPLNKPLFWLYQLGLALILIFVPVLLTFLIGAMAGIGFNLFLFALLALALVYLMMFGVANPKTYNDNTSGVATLLEILAKMPTEKRKEVCVVFFDNEELGLLGSKGFVKAYPRVNQKLLINFDCVSDGKNILFVYDKKMKEENIAVLKDIFKVNDSFNIQFVSSQKAVYPSDQKNFKNGVGVAALKKKGNLLYLDKIHTIFDTNFQEENIEYLSDSFIDYLNK